MLLYSGCDCKMLSYAMTVYYMEGDCKNVEACDVSLLYGGCDYKMLRYAMLFYVLYGECECKMLRYAILFYCIEDATVKC